MFEISWKFMVALLVTVLLVLDECFNCSNSLSKCIVPLCMHRKGPSIKYVRKIFQKTNISNPLIRTRTREYQRVRNVSFSENFAYVLNGWPLMKSGRPHRRSKSRSRKYYKTIFLGNVTIRLSFFTWSDIESVFI